jgi:hypothetical protein
MAVEMARKGFVPFLDAATDVFYADLRKLLELSPEQLSALAKRFNSDDGFEFPDDEAIHELVSQYGIPAGVLGDVISISSFIHNSMIAEDVDADTLLEHIKNVAVTQNLSLGSKQRAALRKLFEVTPTHRARAATAVQLNSTTPTLHAIDGLCDLRALFSETEPESHQLVGFVPRLTLTIYAEDNHNDYSSITFQMGLDRLDDLITQLTNFRRRLAEIEKKAKTARILASDVA